PEALLTEFSANVAVVWFAASARTEPLARETLLNVVEEEPPMLCVAVPVKLMVLLLAVNEVPLFVQFPPTVCVKEPALKVVPEPKVTLPVVLIAAAAVAEAVPDIVKLPETVIADPGIVFVPLPLRVRLP